MPSSVVTAFREAIRSKKIARTDPDLSVVSHCIAQALALTPAELERVTAGVRAGITAGKFKTSVPADAAGKIDETKLPPMPKLPPTRTHFPRVGPVSERLVTRLVATCATLSPKELVLVTQGVRAGVATRKT